MNQDQKRVLFLFGAGASVSAGCDSVANFTQWLLDQFHANPLFVAHRNWLVSLWELIENTSWGFAPKEIRDQMPHLKRFEPNFEDLVTAIEALQEYIHSGAATSMPSPAPNILEKIGFRHISNESVLGFLMGRLLEEKKFSKAISQFVSLFATLSFIGARNSIVKLICNHFPENYELDDLADFVDCLRDEALQITIATTNYDLVLETLFEKNSVDYRDGFVDSETLSRWVGL